jgi:hypothetical protein
MKAFCKDLSAVAMRAIKTDQFVDRELVECLTLLGVRDPTEFAKFLAIAAPKQSYLTGRPHADGLEPREAINPGEYRRPPIPEWRLGFDPTLRAYTPVPVDPALTPQDAHHEVCGSPLSPAPGWEVRLRGRAFSSDRTEAQNVDSGMEDCLRPEAQLVYIGPRRPQIDQGTGLPRALRLASLPGARLEMGVKFQDTAIDTVTPG